MSFGNLALKFPPPREPVLLILSLRSCCCRAILMTTYLSEYFAASSISLSMSSKSTLSSIDLSSFSNCSHTLSSWLVAKAISSIGALLFSSAENEMFTQLNMQILPYSLLIIHSDQLSLTSKVIALSQCTSQ